MASTQAIEAMAKSSATMADITFRSGPGVLDSNDSAEEEESNHPSQHSDDSKLVKRPKAGV